MTHQLDKRHDGTAAYLDRAELAKRPGEIGRLAFQVYALITKRRLDRTPPGRRGQRIQERRYSYAPSGRSAAARATMGRAPLTGGKSDRWRASDKGGDDDAMTPMFSDAIIATEQKEFCSLGAANACELPI